MKKWVTIDKEVGQTPLQAVEAYKAWAPGMQDAKMAYAGRLDPMASGKLLVLIGEECKKQEYYHGLDKTYEVEVLLGATSDTGDVLGLVKTCSMKKYTRNKLIGVIRSMRGDFTAPYPRYSSKTVNGKPLFMWALEDRLDEITIPKQHGYIYRISIKKVEARTGQTLHDTALEKVHSLKTVTEETKALGADFRRADVSDSWQRFLHKYADQEFEVATLTITCSSGTYMRSLAEVIGTKLGGCALAYSIHRTKIGRQLWLPFGLSIWMRTYTSKH